MPRLLPLSHAGAVLALAGTLFAAFPASAQYRDGPDWRNRGDWHDNRGGWQHDGRGGYHQGHHDNAGAIVGGALLGLGLGAILGGALAAPPAYYAPPPPPRAYYAPPPVFYAPPPVYYASPVPPGYDGY